MRPEKNGNRGHDAYDKSKHEPGPGALHQLSSALSCLYLIDRTLNRVATYEPIIERMIACPILVMLNALCHTRDTARWNST